MLERPLRLLLFYGFVWGLAWPNGSAQSSGLAQQVRHQLLTLPFYTVFDDLNFKASGNTVTLLGQTTRAALKNNAEKAVKSIEGVGHVADQIEVLPPSAEDDRIRLAVYTATYGQPILDGYARRAVPPVHIIVKNGNVTLVGIVDSQMDKTSFFTQASTVPGVTSVTDYLQVTR